jgi:hypothetical protein
VCASQFFFLFGFVRFIDLKVKYIYDINCLV